MRKMETICKESQILFLGENKKKNITNLSSAELAQRSVKVNKNTSVWVNLAAIFSLVFLFHPLTLYKPVKTFERHDSHLDPNAYNGGNVQITPPIKLALNSPRRF